MANASGAIAHTQLIHVRSAAGTEVIVGDVERRKAQLQAHRKASGGGDEPGSRHPSTQGGEIRYVVERLLPAALVPEEEPSRLGEDSGRLGNRSGVLSSGRRTRGATAVDLELRLLRVDGLITAGDTQGLGLGYVPRDPSAWFLNDTTRRTLPLVTDLDAAAAPVTPTTTTIATRGGGGAGRAAFFAPGVDRAVVPRTLYAPSRAPAVGAHAAWADRTDHVHWLPANLTEFDRRVEALAGTLA